MARDVYLALVVYGPANEPAALDLLLPTLRRVFPDGSLRALIIDNASLDACGSRPTDDHSVRIAGDNRVHEFSGWDRGLAWLDERYRPHPEAIVVLANDTVARPDKIARLRDLPADRVAAAEHGALVGWIEEYPRQVELFGLPLRHFIDTSFVVGQRRTFAALGPFAPPAVDAGVFGDDWRSFFREPSPLGELYRAYLRTYFFGEQIAPEFDQRWSWHEPLSERNFGTFKQKLRCVFCEHLLSARARAQGVPLADIRATQPIVVQAQVARPCVSVLIPCYNAGAYLDDAVDSALAQTFQDFEVIVVDDGSTDATTQALIADYRRPKTRVVRIEHAGVSAARNAAIDASTGRYLCALDADDRLEPTFLEKAVKILDEHPSLTFVSCWARNFGEEEWNWKPERCDLPSLLCEDTVCTAALVRREAVLDIGGYDTAIPIQGMEDWELWLTLVERGHRGVILPEVLFNYRRRSGSLSSVSWYGEGHVPLTSYRIAKHRESYRTHVRDVLLYQDTETGGYLRRSDELERHIGSELEPIAAAQRAELARLQAICHGVGSGSSGDQNNTPDPVTNRVHELETSLDIVAAERDALRDSMSWRVTAPLRDMYGWWLRRRGSA